VVLIQPFDIRSFPVALTDWHFFIEHFLHAAKHFTFFFCFFFIKALDFSIKRTDFLGEVLNVLRNQLSSNDFHVTDWVDISLFVDDFLIWERSYNVKNAIDRLDM